MKSREFSPKLSMTLIESQNLAQIFGAAVKGWINYFITQLKYPRAFVPRNYQLGNNYTYTTDTATIAVLLYFHIILIVLALSKAFGLRMAH
jgi:hypothetical protein